MHADWQNYLNALNISASFVADETPLLSFPEGFALLSVTGDDRHGFLHGQFINDMNLIKEPGAQLNGWCNPKGQLIVNFLVINTGTTYLLLFREDLKEYVQKRLTMFVLRARVTIEDITGTTPLLGVANCADTSILATNVNQEPGSVTAEEGIITVCLPDQSQRYLLLGNVEAQIARTTGLQKSLTLTKGNSWALLDILAGLPWISSATQEKFLPQFINLDALNGLSYQKGCYPGQEVIARLHYRGEIKRRLQLITADSELNEGMAIKTAQDDNAGTVVNAVQKQDDGFIGLAVIDLDKLEQGLYPETEKNSAIALQSLPYATP